MAYGSLLSDVVQSSTAGTPPQFNDGNGTQVGTLCRAWVNFNGTGTVAIRASFNVSSITDNGTGDYTVNFTNAMSDANYAVVSNFSYISGDTSYNVPIAPWLNAPSASNVRVGGINYGSGANVDSLVISVAIFR